MSGKGVKPGTGESTQHSTNKQFERGPGVKNQPFVSRGNTKDGREVVQGNKWKSPANPNPPNNAEAKNTAPKVHMTPKINEGTGGQPDGAKRIINTEGHPQGRNSAIGKSTYKAPRSDAGSSPTDLGYTKLGKV